MAGLINNYNNGKMIESSPRLELCLMRTRADEQFAPNFCYNTVIRSTLLWAVLSGVSIIELAQELICNRREN